MRPVVHSIVLPLTLQLVSPLHLVDLLVIQKLLLVDLHHVAPCHLLSRCHIVLLLKTALVLVIFLSLFDLFHAQVFFMPEKGQFHTVLQSCFIKLSHVIDRLVTALHGVRIQSGC